MAVDRANTSCWVCQFGPFPGAEPPQARRLGWPGLMVSTLLLWDLPIYPGTKFGYPVSISNRSTVEVMKCPPWSFWLAMRLWSVRILLFALWSDSFLGWLNLSIVGVRHVLDCRMAIVESNDFEINLSSRQSSTWNLVFICTCCLYKVTKQCES